MTDLATKPSELIRATAPEPDSPPIFKSSQIIECIESRLPAEIFIKIADACIEPYSLRIEHKSDNVYEAGFNSSQYCIRGFPLVEELHAILALGTNTAFNEEVEKTIQNKFQGRLELAPAAGEYLNRLVEKYDMSWLLADVRQLVVYDLTWDPIPRINYNLFPNITSIEIVQMLDLHHFQDNLFTTQWDSFMTAFANGSMKRFHSVDLAESNLDRIPDALSKITISLLIACPEKTSPFGPSGFNTDIDDDVDRTRDERAAAIFKFSHSEGVTNISSKELVEIRYQWPELNYSLAR